MNKIKIYGYREASLGASLFFVLGFILELLGVHFSYEFLHSPNNVVFGIGLTLFLTLIFYFFKNTQLIKWLSQAQVTIVVLILLGILVLIMGVLPQTPEQKITFITSLAFNRITASWPFIFTMLIFITNLWFSTLKKIIPFHLKNFGFFLNHAGLFVAVMGGFLGVSDLQRVTMEVYEGDTNWKAVTNKREIIEVPLAITLHDFQIEQYAPKLGLANNATGELFPAEKPVLYLIENDSITGQIAEWKIEVLGYIEDAMPFGNGFHSYKEDGSAPAAQIRVTNLSTNKINEGWISCGSFMSVPASLLLDSNYSVVMTAPEPKKFSSDVTIYEQSGDKTQVVLEVNKPVSIAGWDIYQLGYNVKFGKWSKSSTIELVYDPWIKLVYMGIFMMLLGALYSFWKGREIINK